MLWGVAEEAAEGVLSFCQDPGKMQKYGPTCESSTLSLTYSKRGSQQ